MFTVTQLVKGILDFMQHESPAHKSDNNTEQLIQYTTSDTYQ
jgi:hypothetical protein